MDLNTLESTIKGRVITPESEGYDAARTPWHLSIQQRPKLIVMARDADDIVQAIRYAKSEGLKVGVMNTGHGIARPADDNLLIVLSELKGVEIDPVRKTARVEAGAKWSDVLSLSQEAGLAPLLGSSSDVGAVGFSLGGGMGWLARKYGLAQDSVLSYEMVTGAGEKIRVSPEEHPELFWGLKGGGASFGVVTAMELRLFPVEKVFAGTLFYGPEDAGEIFRRYRQWSSALSDDWTTSVSIGNFPDLEMVPEPLRGKSMTMVRGCFDGKPEEGKKDLKFWLDWKEPLLNMFGELPFRESDRISEDPKDPIPAALTNVILREVSDEVIDSVVGRGIARSGPSPLLFAEIHQGGGALARADRSQMTNQLQDAPYILKFVGLTPNPELKEALQGILDRIRSEIRPWCTGGLYLNFLTGEEKWTCARSVYPEDSLRRLRALKKSYDPENLFSFNMDLT